MSKFDGIRLIYVVLTACFEPKTVFLFVHLAFLTKGGCTEKFKK